MYQYDSEFYRYLASSSVRSAAIVVPRVLETLPLRSVLDVGCGAGAWLAAYERSGIRDYVGVDGAYVRAEQLLIDRDKFDPRNVGESFDLQRSFDLVQCLEVGEHVPGPVSGVLVDNIVRHGKLVLFSAAIPGQGGENHINERPFSFWRSLFKARGYRPFDGLRPAIHGDLRVDWWYRYNPLFYAHDSIAEQLPQALRATLIPDSAPIRSVAPIGFRLRCGLMRVLPSPLITRIAVAKHKVLIRRLPKAR